VRWAFVRRDEVVRVLDHGYFVLGDSGLTKTFNDVSIHAPSHRADEAFRRWRHKRCAYLQQLRYERSWIVWDPITHHNAATWFCDPDHLPGHVEGLGCKHGSEYGDGQIERMIADPLQVARISLLKLQPVETRLRSSFVPGFNEVPGNVDSNDFSPQTGQGNRRRAISAAKVQNPQRRRYSERLNECLARLAHQGGNLGEVAFLPQCFVWIHSRADSIKQTGSHWRF